MALTREKKPEIPQKIGKYNIIREVGRGSSGTVYLSHDPFYGRDVAIKLYQEVSGDDPREQEAARKMFFNEAQMVGRLQHPNILPIYDAGEEDGRYYVVMEHVHGARTLSAYCRADNLLPIDEVVRIMFSAVRAMHYAHTRGLVHRDIKPSNIMLTIDNEVRVIDFGIAMWQDAEISAIRGVAGSPSYMSPEQVKADEVTPRSDLYALGAVMYELLTGRRPFKASNLAKLLHQIVFATPLPIHRIRTDVPEDLEEIVWRAMRKKPTDRFSSGLEFAAALTQAHQSMRNARDVMDERERVGLLRGLHFFHDFSHTEIRELMKAAAWREYAARQDIVRQGDMDDRFYVIVSGEVAVESDGKQVGRLAAGDCFGESSAVPNARRLATIRAIGPVTLLQVSSTMLETLSASCQLRFNRTFLKNLIQRLHGHPAR
ncbi:serine/threonine-protein kinase [Thioalkalivibrio sp. XN279]|uniref:serine/threonine-protein kinase n=1 Tax=Thioalkalivibrio sp. XN279 TaxID=2714953 RepID=UPI00140CA215|nr:serine/threonine-protein kinase [Thioalkalivibrio sp. XN279]NHA15548.1 protein kinase [Thioalkalivibrio sp. XN279]